MGAEILTLAAVALASTALTTGVSLATRPGTPRVTPPQAPPPPPAPAAAPPLAPTEVEAGAGTTARKERDALRFGLARTVIARRAPVGTSGGLGGSTSLGG